MTSIFTPIGPHQAGFAPGTVSVGAGGNLGTNAAETPGTGGSQNVADASADESTKFDLSMLSDASRRRGPRVSNARVLLVMNQLTVMSKNGIEIADAFESVARNCNDDRLADVLAKIHDALTSGQSLSDSMAQHGYCFPPSLAPMLAAAEASGEVPETLRRASTRLRDEMQMRSSIVGALIYPVILVSISTFVILALVLGVLPQFGRVFASLGKPIPVYTQWLLGIGTTVREHWMIIVPTLLVTVITLFSLRRHRLVIGPIVHFFMYSPVLRDAYRPLVAGRSLRALSAMVAGGVPMLQAVQLASRTATDPYWRSLLLKMKEKLIDGLPASNALVDVDFVPAETHQLMVTAEKTGRLAEVFEDIGVYYEEEAARRMKRIVSALEPLIIVVMGVLVAAIVMAVMLPLLDVTTASS